MTTEQPRTLAEDLRARGDGALSLLLQSRPDLLSPVPNDLTQLATRAATRASVVRALERLDRFTLQTAEALAVAPDGCDYRTLSGLMAGTGDAARTDAEAALPEAAREEVEAALPRALGVLRAQALVWGGDDRLRLVRTARDLLAPVAGSPSATGLGPTVAEATAGMSPGRIQEIVAAAGLPPTHDPVTAAASLAALFADEARMPALLADAPEPAKAVLGKLVWGPPYGEVANSTAPSRPVRWLLDRGLLLPAGRRNVLLPREVALHLRGGRAHRVPEPSPPGVEAVARNPQAVDANAAGQAFGAVRTVEELLKQWETGGPPVLRAGGVGVRDLKRLASALDLPEAVAAFWLELAYAAGLVASDDEADEAYAPTPGYDDWLRLPVQHRWAALAVAWLSSTRTPGLVGTRDAKGRALSALGPDLDRSLAPEIRRRALEFLGSLPAGSCVDPAQLLARSRWERPLRGSATMDALRAELVRWTVTEAELLGVTGRGALAGHGRALLGALSTAGSGPAPGAEDADDGDRPAPGSRSTTARTDRNAARSVAARHQPGAPGTGPGAGKGRPGGKSFAEEAAQAAAEAAAAALAPLLPAAVDYVLLQADLTAVAPGPLQAPLAETLNVLADVESKGGATVYRFTPESVRRALDAGRTAAELHAFLAEHSRTPVPQPLSYLVDDVARRHGRLRVGAASAYLRCDDDALLGELLADRRAVGLGLRRLAPTVLAAQSDPAVLLERLRAMGFAPAAESADGDLLITRPDARRSPPRTAPTPVTDGPPRPDATLLGAAVTAIRAGDRASTAVRRETVPAPADGNGRLPRSAAAETLATIQAAVLTGEAVWIGYVNAEGSASQRVIGPVRVEGGFVTAYDHTAEEVRTFALHRITGVSELADDRAP